MGPLETDSRMEGLLKDIYFQVAQRDALDGSEAGGAGPRKLLATTQCVTWWPLSTPMGPGKRWIQDGPLELSQTEVRGTRPS